MKVPTDNHGAQPLELNGNPIKLVDNPASYDLFKINYLKLLDWEIDRQGERLERLESLKQTEVNIREEIAQIRSDPEQDGITRAERHEIHELRDDLSHVRDRIDRLPDLDTMEDRYWDLQMEFIEKSDAWDISI